MLKLLATVLLLTASGSPRRTYTDPADRITFSYPASWLLNADDDAATAKLRLADLAQPRAVVQLEGNFSNRGPYKGTDFEAGAFAYTVTPAAPDACLVALDPIATGTEKPIETTWHGLPARRLDATFTVAGTDDLHTIVAVAEPERCLLFETVLIRKSVGEGITSLAPERWAMLRAQFVAVLQSVRVLLSASTKH